MSPDTLTTEYLKNGISLIRETFDGGLPGQGTAYLDHSSGIRSTLKAITAEQASRRLGGHPSIAAHARHMNFHMRVGIEWIQGDHSKRDWLGSFEPQTVTDEEWILLQNDLDATRQELVRLMESLSPEALADEGAGMGAIAHLAYHLGAIRQLMHLVR